MHFPRFLVAGGINTAATYVLYLGLLQLVPYAVAYTLTYAAGIVLGYVLNAYWVFRGRFSLRSALQYPAAYLVNYLLGLSLLWVFVEMLHLRAAFAPLAVLVVTTPLMYLMSKSVFQPKEQK